jgi:predicted methyltransferase
VSGNSSQEVTWSVASGGGSISSSGLYSAPATTGSATVMATSIADPRMSAVAYVTVTEEEIRLLTVSPSTVVFGEVIVGNGSAMAVTLANPGTAATTVFSASTAGAGFGLSLEAFPFTVEPGGSAAATIVFKPESKTTVTGSVSFLSNAVDSPATAALIGSGTTVSPYSVALSWQHSPSQVVGYNVYRSLHPDGAYVKVNHLIEPGTSFDDASVDYGMTYHYVVKAVDVLGQESLPSNAISVSVPAS